MDIRIGDIVPFSEVPDLAIFRSPDDHRYQKVGDEAWEVCSRGYVMVRSGEVVRGIQSDMQCRISVLFSSPHILEYERKAEREDGTWFGVGAG